MLEPQIVHLPPDVHSLAAAEEAIELADSYGIADGHPLDESQRFTLRAGLGERADGSWSASTVGDFEPRQNGKNDTCAARELAGLILFGERLQLHTAHEFATANESFLRMVAVFENWDDLRKKVARIRYANGEQGIELLSGQRLKYRARTGGSGRGFAKADLVVYDEAQHLQAEHVAASGPARLANPNNQSWYMGSGGLASSSNAWRMRRRALAGDGGRFAYVEHTAEKVTLIDGHVVSERPDVLDRDAWAAGNAAYGRRISDESMLSLYEELGPELFARECLCVWDPEPTAIGDQVIPTVGWAACADRAHIAMGKLSYALDADSNRDGYEWCAIGTSDGEHLEVVTPPDAGPGLGWVVPLVVARRDRFDEILLDPSGPAGKLIAPLEQAKIKVRKVKSDEFVQACGQLVDAVASASVRHIDQPVLNRAVAGAVRREVGDGAWRLSRTRSTVDISPLVAVALARWAATSRKASPAPMFAIT